MFEGSWVALVTPFTDGQVDVERLKKLVEFHVEQGTTGIVPCGTTGESATLTHDEHQRVIETVVQAARGRVQVMAGTGSNATAEAVRLTQHARKAGADGALLIAPYYNKPTQEGLYRHYKAIADSVDLPLVPYNIASRTAVNILPETFARIVRECRNIVAVKEASGNLEQMSRIRELCGEDFTILSGDDALTLPVLCIGGRGVISVIANLVPSTVVELIAAFNEGRMQDALAVHERTLPLVRSMFLETNPIPVKTAMAMLGQLDSAELRLPLCEMSSANRELLRRALADYGLLSSAKAKATV